MAKDAVKEVAEGVIDAVDEQIDAVKHVAPSNFNMNGMTKRQQLTILALVAVGSAAASGGITYLLTKRSLTAKYEKIAEKEIAEAKEFYSTLNKKGDYATPESAVKKLGLEVDESQPDENPLVVDAVNALRIYAGEVKAPAETEEELIVEGDDTDAHLETIEGRTVEVTRIVDSSKGGLSPADVVRKNIFQEARSDDRFDYEEELANRTPERPYVIHHDEFYNGGEDFEQITLTYYEGDDVLIDDQDKPIEDTEGLVGNSNLNRFGHGSKDNNVVYIRNERLELDIEVVRHGGEYTREVLGFIEHSDDHYVGRTRRFRDTDG